MAIKTLVNFIVNNPISLILKMNKILKEFYRSGFISTAISEGIYDVLSCGPASIKEIQKAIGSDFNPKGLAAWLDVGVSLGELAKNSAGDYRIKSRFSKKLLKSENDTWEAFFQARVEIFYNYIIQTPAFLRQNKTCRLLEVGCGSGIYIKRACERNPNLTAMGIELQKGVAEFAQKNMSEWNLEDRVDIEPIDIRKYKCEKKFDVVTFFNLIYYFPADERVDLLRHLGGCLNPGGRLILTTLCPLNDPSIQLMNLWAAMTDGCGPLPFPDQVCDQLEKACFNATKSEKLIPGFYLFETLKNI